MKKIILSAMLLISISAKSESKDTIHVKEGYVMVKTNKWGPFHKVKCEYILVENGKYYVNGKELKFIKHIENSPTVKN